MDERSPTGIEVLDAVDVALASEGAERAPELPAIARLGRYEILGRLAIGGMAEIFLARERSAAVGGSRQLVVKIMRPELEGDPVLRAMFLHEGRVALTLSHPHICHVYECGVEAGRCFIAMEHVRGVTLRALMRKSEITHRRLPPSIVARIGAHVAEALHAAHTAKDASGRPLGLVHRDVSPQNVMIGEGGVVKLLDFGVAHARTELGLEQPGMIKGKLGYLAPEQCLGQQVDARTDVFALGVVLWEAVTGRRLYPRSADAGALAAVVNEDAPDAHAVDPDVPESLAAILRRALSRAPADRFGSAAELQHALEGYLAERREIVNGARIAALVEELFGGSPPLELDRRAEAVAWIPAEPPSRRLRWAWLAGSALAVLALAPAAWALVRSESAVSE
ncbi:MAG TPA: serine/threonine-protein kinase, partial [Sandaracinaceae bacterium]